MNSRLAARSSYSSERQELAARILKLLAHINCNKREHMEMGWNEREQQKC
jgi:hypothetical protein